MRGLACLLAVLLAGGPQPVAADVRDLENILRRGLEQGREMIEESVPQERSVERVQTVVGDIEAAAEDYIVMVADRDMSSELRKGSVLTIALSPATRFLEGGEPVTSADVTTGRSATVQYRSSGGELTAVKVTLLPGSRDSGLARRQAQRRSAGALPGPEPERERAGSQVPARASAEQAFELGKTSLAAGRYQDAAQHLSLAIEQGNRSAEVFDARAEAHAKLGSAERAGDDYTEAASIRFKKKR